MALIFKTVLAVSLLYFVTGKQTDGVSSSVCSNRFCKAGRECVAINGKAKCQCMKTCPTHPHKVCGSDDRTYHNNCELHRTACVEKRKIHVDYRGPCKSSIWRKLEKKKPTKKHLSTKPHRPVACYQVERDELHMMLVKWMYSMARTNKWLKKAEMLKVLEENIFKMCDLDHDGFVISSEFLMCTQKNNSKQISDDEKTHRGLCLDAIFDMADKNSDWKFDIVEFKHVFNTDFVPPTEKCSLKHRKYEDGYEIGFHCNTCVCACGKWVCASSSCKGDGSVNAGKLHKGKIPGNKKVRRFLEGFIASDLVQIKKVQREYRRKHKHGQ